MSDAILTLHDVHSAYGHVEVLRGVSLEVQAGELVTVIGGNGAGKSTLLKTIVGLLPCTGGRIELDRRDLGRATPERLVRDGVVLVPEGRLLFPQLTVAQNLELGAYGVRNGRRAAVADGLGLVYGLFPVLSQRRGQSAETLSGGEQQMLAVGRALMSQPRLLLLDEPSLGLAPRVIAEIFSALDVLRSKGLTILLVEQDARLALRHADRGYVMSVGRVAHEGSAEELLSDETVRTIYLGAL